MAQWTQEKSAELGGMAHIRPGRRAKTGGLISRFTLRTVALALGVEFPYAVLVPIAYLQMAGIADPGQRRQVIAFLGVLHLFKTVFLASWLVHLLRPIERWHSTLKAGRDPNKEVLCAAGLAAYQTPITFAVVWALSWGAMYILLTPLSLQLTTASLARAEHPLLATLLFSYACMAAALPLAHGILGWVLAPVAARISLQARERGVALPGRTTFFAQRLIVLAVCLATAPTSWMVALTLARVASPMNPDQWVTLVLFSVVAVSWAPLCAAFLAGAVAHPLRHVTEVIGQIIQHGDGAQPERVPILFKDEVGALAEGVNTMVDRLQENGNSIRSYLAERERLLEEAARRAAQLETILDNVVEGVFAYDRDGHLTRVNASGLRLLGQEGRSEAGGAPLLSLASEPATLQLRRADGTPYVREQMPVARALAGETIVQEVQILRHPRTGRDLFLRTSAAPIRGPSGAILGAVAVARDVTEVLQLDQMKDHFIRVAAHELKTPVTIMKGYALMLLRSATDVSERQRQMLQAIDRGADRITGIIDDLLEVSQAFLSRFQINLGPVELGSLLDEEMARAGRRTQRHRLRRTGEIDPVVVRGDAQRLRQVLARLLGNAVTYSPDGGNIEVSLSIRPSSPGHLHSSSPRSPSGAEGEAVVAVHDHGVGIPIDKQPHIFQLFYRAHTDTPFDYGGMGIGLYISKHLIAEQGGRVWFESEEGKGSTFYFSVPLA
jgi:two-component system sensor histidine kinase VicK